MSDPSKKKLRKALAKESQRRVESEREVLDLTDDLNDLTAGLRLWYESKVDEWTDKDEALWRWVRHRHD